MQTMTNQLNTTTGRNALGLVSLVGTSYAELTRSIISKFNMTKPSQAEGSSLQSIASSLESYPAAQCAFGRPQSEQSFCNHDWKSNRNSIRRGRTPVA